MAREDFSFATKVLVRWAEVDMQGVVFNAHYLAYLDIGVTGYYKAIGHPYTGPFVETGSDLFLKSANLEYHSSAGLDDLIEVCLRVRKIGRSSFEFLSEIYLKSKIITTASLVYVNANPQTRKSEGLPNFFKEAILSFERVDPLQKSNQIK